MAGQDQASDKVPARSLGSAGLQVGILGVGVCHSGVGRELFPQ